MLNIKIIVNQVKKLVKLYKIKFSWNILKVNTFKSVEIGLAIFVGLKYEDLKVSTKELSALPINIRLLISSPDPKPLFNI